MPNETFTLFIKYYEITDNIDDYEICFNLLNFGTANALNKELRLYAKTHNLKNVYKKRKYKKDVWAGIKKRDHPNF